MASTLHLNDEEQQILTLLLRHELNEKKLDQQRTGVLDAQTEILHQEEVIEALLQKLAPPLN